MSEAAPGYLAHTGGTHAETSFLVGGHEEGDCETVVSAVFRYRGNEQRLRVQHLANDEEIVSRAD
jgi:hypothetical protein